MFNIHSLIKNNWNGLCLFVICAVTFLCFLPALNNQLIINDDSFYLFNNSDLRKLDLPHLKRMFTRTILGTYNPLVILTFSFEYALFKYQPFIYHLNNLLLHIGVTVLIFIFAMRVGLSRKAAFLASLLFGIHPLHVQPVAWVSGRKDVLYALFYMLALIQYWRYLEHNNLRDYFLTILWGFLSILAKPMALSLPVILIVLDVLKKEKWSFRYLWEKIPHFLYIIPISWVTYSLNSRWPVQDFQEAFFVWVYCFAFYIQKFVWPVELSIMYPVFRPIALSNPVYLTALIVFLLTIAMILFFRRERWVLFAVVFYFFSIVFLLRYDTRVDLNLVADRFMYLPSLGFCLLFGYTLDKIKERFCSKRTLMFILASLFLVLGFTTWQETKIWKDDFTAWNNNIKRYPQSFIAYNYRGEIYRSQGEFDLALKDFNQALVNNPDYVEAYNNRGVFYNEQKNYDLAINDYSKALEIARKDYLYMNRGISYMKLGEINLALDDFNAALNINPRFAMAYLKRGILYFKHGQLELALDDFNKTIQNDPESSQAYNNRCGLYLMEAKYDLAIADCSAAIALSPDDPIPYSNRFSAYFAKKQFDLALKDARMAKSLGFPNMELHIKKLEMILNN